MVNSRSILPELWAQAWDALVTYFSRRYGREDAQDLAQETLAAVLQRDDYLFRDPEDFLRVCHGFARNVLKAAIRSRAATEPWDDSAPLPERDTVRSSPDEALFLDEVLRTGKRRLEAEEWRLIREAAAAQMRNEPYDFEQKDANRMRVRLHRARKRLARFTGWRK